jgi:hypothetical protein
MKQLYSNFLIYLSFWLAVALDLLGVTFGPQAPFNRAMRRQMGAVVNVKDTVITNADLAGSAVTYPNKAFLARARPHWMRGVVTSANGDSIASVYRFCRVKSNDLVNKVIIDNASCGAGCTANIGLVDTAANGGAAVSASLFTAALDINAVNRALDVTRQSGTITVANMEKRIWELLGLAADPQKEYDVCATLTAAAAAAGAICISVEVVPAAG